MLKKVFMCFVALLAMAFALPASAMQIYVHYGNGTWPSGTTSLNGSGNLTLEVEASDSFENLKAKIEDKSGLTPAHITLSYGTYDNLPNDGTLYQYGITSGGTTLTMTYNPLKYTSAVAMSALQVGDTLAEGFSLTGEDANFIYFVANRHKHNENLSGFLENITLDKIQSIGANCVFSTLVNDESITFAPVNENGQDGDAWVVTGVDSYDVFTEITIAGIRIPGPPHTIRLAAGTEDAANWTLASGNASVQGDQVLENVMSGSQVTATYNGTQKVKSVKAVKYVPPVLVSSIVLDKQTAYLAKDSTLTLTASVLPENAADKSYTWSSDNTSVATVNATTGVVTGHTAGTANIIATANDGSGVKDTCVVTVLRPAILDGVTVLYASDYDLETWSTVMGYNPGLMYQDGDDVRLTSNGAILFHDGHPVDVDEFFYPTVSNNEYQWMRVTNIDGADFYYHQGETWQQAIDADRQDNFMWSIEGGQVKNMMQTLVDSNYNPVDPAATIDPSTVNYHLWSLDN